MGKAMNIMEEFKVSHMVRSKLIWWWGWGKSFSFTNLKLSWEMEDRELELELEEEVLLSWLSLNCLSTICCVIEGLRDNVSSQSHVWSSNIDSPTHSSSDSDSDSESYKCFNLQISVIISFHFMFTVIWKFYISWDNLVSSFQLWNSNYIFKISNQLRLSKL